MLVFLLSKEIVEPRVAWSRGPLPSGPRSQLAIVHDHLNWHPSCPRQYPNSILTACSIGLLISHIITFCMATKSKRNVAYHRVRKSLTVDDWYAILTITVYSFYRNPYRQMHFRAQISSKSLFGWGSAPDPARGAYDAPQSPSRLERETPPPHFPLDAFGVSISAPSAPRFPVGPPRCKVRRAHQMLNPALKVYIQ